jgi:transcriptional regulator with XRE-family HTH domain
MDMQVDAQLIKSERLKRAWSQEQLAQVSGLGIRTIQRIENGENASLETVKSLAAVLELPVERVIVDTPLTSPHTPSRLRLFKPWPAFAAGCVTTLITLGGLFIMQGATAEQVDMDVEIRVDDDDVARSRVVSEDGAAVILDVSEVVRLTITPSVTENGGERMVVLEAEIFLFEDGEYKQVSNPRITTLNGQKALFKIGDEQFLEAEDGSLEKSFNGVEVAITPKV